MTKSNNKLSGCYPRYAYYAAPGLSGHVAAPGPAKEQELQQIQLLIVLMIAVHETLNFNRSNLNELSNVSHVGCLNIMFY